MMHLEKYPNVFCFLSCYEYGDMIPKGTFYFPYKALFFTVDVSSLIVADWLGSLYLIVLGIFVASEPIQSQICYFLYENGDWSQF